MPLEYSRTGRLPACASPTLSSAGWHCASGAPLRRAKKFSVSRPLRLSYSTTFSGR